MMAKAEDLIRKALKDKVEGDNLVLLRREDKRKATRVKEDGTTEEYDEHIGTLTVSVPIQTFCDFYRDILEDDTKHPKPKLHRMKDKIFKDDKGNEYDPGFRAYIEEWIKEGIDL
jgi:hypothetical protein